MIALRGRWVAIAGLALGLLLIAAAAHAQTPFGMPRPSAAQQSSGIVGYILAKQSEFYRALSGLIRAA